MNALEPDDAGWSHIEECLNNTGLIEVYRGRPDTAAQVCELQLQWAERLVERHGIVAAGGNMVQPWINLGRLRRIEGNCEAALPHFSLVVDTLANRPVRVGNVEFEAASWQAITRQREWYDILKNVYVIDSVKTYFVARDFFGALDFLRQARALCGEEPFALLEEMEFLTLTRLGRFDDAAVLLGGEAWNGGGFQKLLRVTYRVGLHAARDELTGAQRLMENLATRVLSIRGLDKPDDPCILRYLYHLGGLASRLGLDARAAQIFRLGLGAAQHVDDVPCCLAFLDALIDARVEDRGALADARDVLLRDCLYAPLLQARGLSIDPAALADPVFNELHDKLRGAMEHGQCLDPPRNTAAVPG